MPLSKKRKITAVADQQEGTPVEAPRPAVAVAEPQDQIGLDKLLEETGTQTQDTSNVTQAVTQNQERQERFKALQARAVRHTDRLPSRLRFYGYAQYLLL